MHFLLPGRFWCKGETYLIIKSAFLCSIPEILYFCRSSKTQKTVFPSIRLKNTAHKPLFLVNYVGLKFSEFRFCKNRHKQNSDGQKFTKNIQGFRTSENFAKLTETLTKNKVRNPCLKIYQNFQNFRK